MTMRLFAEDRKSGSLTLLTSAPATLTEIVLGKFLGLSAFFLAVLVLMALMAFSLIGGTELDTGRLLAGLLGQLLLMLSFGAAGLFVSTLTKEPVIAAVGGFGLLLIIWLFEAMAYGSGMFSELFRHLSLIGHFEKLRRGVFDTADVAYYLLFITLFLWLAVQRLDVERA
jgi:ABC-2 type transport system permease protein